MLGLIEDRRKETTSVTMGFHSTFAITKTFVYFR